MTGTTRTLAASKILSDSCQPCGNPEKRSHTSQIQQCLESLIRLLRVVKQEVHRPV